jgi:hypothetical protein
VKRSLLAVVALSLACHKERPLFDRVQLELAGKDDASILGQTEEQVKGMLVDALKASGFQSASEVKEPKGVFRVQAALAMQEVKDPDAPAKAEAIVQLKRSGEEFGREVKGRGEGKVKGPSLDERRDASRAAVELALRDAASQAALLVKLSSKSDADLIGEKDPKAKDLAVMLLAERRNPAALEPLLEQLKSDDLDVVHRAIGGLLELHDARAVGPLIDASRQKGDLFQSELLFALSSLGGEEALAYLQLIVDGADQPLMRQLAQQALEELKARVDGGLVTTRKEGP